MYILSQDKKTLMEFGRIEVSRNLTTNKDERIALCAWSRALTSTMTVGLYPDEEAAYAELRRIIDALNAGAAVYEIN